MRKRELEKLEKAERARQYLLENYITTKTKLLIVIKSVSNSGMARRMRVIVGKDFNDISYWIADLCDLSINEKGLLVQGCGMDMTFWLADYITAKLWLDKKPKNLYGCLAWTSF